MSGEGRRRGSHHAERGKCSILTDKLPYFDRVLWTPISFSVSVKTLSVADSDQRKEECNSLGIRLERSKQFVASSTHYVTRAVNYTVPLFNSLVALASIVTPDYIDEVVRRAKLSNDEEDSLQKVFRLPDAKDYFPDEVTTELMSREDSRDLLASNELRRTLFVGTTLLLVHGEEGLNKSIEQQAGICKGIGARLVTLNASTLDDYDAMLRFLRRTKSEAETYVAECGEAASQAPDEGLVVVCSDGDIEADWHGRVVTITRK